MIHPPAQPPFRLSKEVATDGCMPAENSAPARYQSSREWNMLAPCRSKSHSKHQEAGEALQIVQSSSKATVRQISEGKQRTNGAHCSPSNGSPHSDAPVPALHLHIQAEQWWSCTPLCSYRQKLLAPWKCCSTEADGMKIMRASRGDRCQQHLASRVCIRHSGVSVKVTVRCHGVLRTILVN